MLIGKELRNDLHWTGIPFNSTNILTSSCFMLQTEGQAPLRWITWNKSRLFMETKILKLLGKKVKNPLDLDKLFFFLHDYGSLHGPFI